MTLHRLRTGAGWRIESLAAQPQYEITAFGPLPAALALAWPTSAGGVLRDDAGMPALLHVAPSRWIAPGSGLDLSAGLAQASTFGTVVDVTGKWAGWQVTGAAAGGLLAGTIAIDAVLTGRQCAAVTLFDCPALVARHESGFLVWVQASFAQHFLAACDPPGTRAP